MIERFFGVLKKCFQVLKTPPAVFFKTQVLIVYVLCGLNNFICQKGIEADDIYKQETFDDEEEDKDDSSATDLEWTLSINSSSAMAKKRDKMAKAMWVDYEAYLLY